MSTVTVELPDALRKYAELVAQRENVSLNQLISSALEDKVTVLMSEDYLEMRANRGNAKRLRELLTKAPDVPAPEFDQL